MSAVSYVTYISGVNLIQVNIEYSILDKVLNMILIDDVSDLDVLYEEMSYKGSTDVLNNLCKLNSIYSDIMVELKGFGSYYNNEHNNSFKIITMYIQYSSNSVFDASKFVDRVNMLIKLQGSV